MNKWIGYDMGYQKTGNKYTTKNEIMGKSWKLEFK